MQKPTDQEARSAVQTILRWVGDDPDRPGLQETPERVLRAWKEFTQGYRQSPEEVLSKRFDLEEETLPNGGTYDELILSRDIPFTSFCEHHMLPFMGHAHVAYIPQVGGPVVGLSKLARLVDVFAQRLQVQERLTEQIAQTLEVRLKPRGVAVIIKARHTCQCMRGVRKDGSMVTSAMYGFFRENRDGARMELLELVKL